jgi:hypothetical protein
MTGVFDADLLRRSAELRARSAELQELAKQRCFATLRARCIAASQHAAELRRRERGACRLPELLKPGG